MPDISEISKLLKKKLQNTISDQEQGRLLAWGKEHPKHEDLLKRIDDGEAIFEDVLIWLEFQGLRDENSLLKMQHKVFSKTRNEEGGSTFGSWNFFLQYLPYVAALLLISLFSYYQFFLPHKTDTAILLEDLEPGRNHAVITLADGRTIELSGKQGGIIHNEELKYQDGTLVTEIQSDEMLLSELQVPKGGTYKVTLSDGTQVWLNAASKLRYPSTFNDEQRIVELEGEAYFEVSRLSKNNKNQPFIVKTERQEIEVLGTRFNVNAYGSDIPTKTTLAEGAIKVQSKGGSILLKPGEQSELVGDKLYKKNVEIDQYLSWKDNQFIFYETELQEAIQALARWYNFDVVDIDKLPNLHLYGTISRNKKLSEVLEIMGTSGLKFQIEKVGFSNKLIIINE